MRIQGVGAGARAHPWGGVSPFEMHYSIAFKHQSGTRRPPLGEILYPPQARARKKAISLTGAGFPANMVIPQTGSGF